MDGESIERVTSTTQFFGKRLLKMASASFPCPRLFFSPHDSSLFRWKILIVANVRPPFSNIVTNNNNNNNIDDDDDDDNGEIITRARCIVFRVLFRLSKLGCRIHFEYILAIVNI